MPRHRSRQFTCMSENADHATPDQTDTPPPPPWMRASAEDIASVDFEAPLSGAKTADCNELSELYRTAAGRPEGSAEPPETAAVRSFVMLSALTGMYFKPESCALVRSAPQRDADCGTGRAASAIVALPFRKTSDAWRTLRIN
jgi:hypothetical protein